MNNLTKATQDLAKLNWTAFCVIPVVWAYYFDKQCKVIAEAVKPL